jgi:thimet oligopeptidase
MLSKTELMSHAGTSVAMDFVEAPSQLLENWTWNKESLNLFAKHYKTGENIPDTLINNMLAARNLQSGNDLLQQIFYGMLDLTYYDGYDAFGELSTTDVAQVLQNSITNFPYYLGTHQQASSDHLLDYAASYYGYLWSEVYAHDMFTVFDNGGVLNPEIGYRYRKLILEKGGQEEPMEMVINFIGRIPNNNAFLKSVGIE